MKRIWVVLLVLILSGCTQVRGANPPLLAYPHAFGEAVGTADGTGLIVPFTIDYHDAGGLLISRRRGVVTVTKTTVSEDVLIRSAVIADALAGFGVTLPENAVILPPATQQLPKVVSFYNNLGATAALTAVGGYTLGLVDAEFFVGFHIQLVTAHTCTIHLTVNFTDTAGVARIIRLNFVRDNATIDDTINCSTGTTFYAGLTSTIQAKAGTIVSFSTDGTFTSVTYILGAVISQVSI